MATQTTVITESQAAELAAKLTGTADTPPDSPSEPTTAPHSGEADDAARLMAADERAAHERAKATKAKAKRKPAKAKAKATALAKRGNATPAPATPPGPTSSAEWLDRSREVAYRADAGVDERGQSVKVDVTHGHVVASNRAALKADARAHLTRGRLFALVIAYALPVGDFLHDTLSTDERAIRVGMLNVAEARGWSRTPPQ